MSNISKIAWSVVGHGRQKAFLERALAKNRVSQAYFFCGQRHIGKTSLALDFARALTCAGGPPAPCGKCAACGIDQKSGPDLFLIDKDDEIKISEIRELQKKFALKSFFNNRRVAIIADAGLMNDQAANALLKILEEPSEKTHFILVSTHYARVPATIASRTQRVFFGVNTDEDLSAFAESRNSQVPDEKNLENLALGKIGLLGGLYSDPDSAAAYRHYRDIFNTLAERPLAERFGIAAEMSEMENEELFKILDYLIQINDDFLFAGARGAAGRFQSLQKAFENTRAGLSMNLNKKLLLDNFIIQIS